MMGVLVFFFFQAEDGIRDYKVTGVQTCALPISLLGMAGLGVGSPAIWLAWRQWMPQYQVRLATATGRLLNQPLPDGSSLTLDAASRAEVDFYATRRQVRLLAGSAFFAVARDTEWPFMVQAADVQVTVLGTRFEVALEDDAVLVAVDAGRVQEIGRRRVGKECRSRWSPYH